LDKIERALAVLDDDIAAIDARLMECGSDIAAIDARLMECGSDVAAAQEIQVEKDAKTEKQALYYAEWERLEEVMMQAEEIAEEA
jgi:hypothetical protein